MKHTKKSFEKGSGWVIDLVVDLTSVISNYKPITGSSYIKLLKELDHPKMVWWW